MLTSLNQGEAADLVAPNGDEDKRDKISSDTNSNLTGTDPHLVSTWQTSALPVCPRIT
jgi:hypothetical protein